LYWRCPEIRTPWVVTHRGSYECWQVDKEITTWLLANVDHWVYLADKNLAFATGFVLDKAAFTKLPNAVPRVEEKFPLCREDLGIEQDAFVFGVASRATQSKGWGIAINALSSLRQEVSRPIHLVLCGDGEDLGAMKDAHGNKPGIHFLGYQEKIQAFYKLCDCCVLPTRFAGESFPLTIIEAILAGVPVIATDVGEIRSMLRIDTDPMGLTVSLDEDDSVFGKNVLAAMRYVLDSENYASLRASVMRHQNIFSMDKLVDDYIEIYERAISIVAK
jgi:glycosyltransferase involved in cell wall biosynthesis